MQNKVFDTSDKVIMIILSYICSININPIKLSNL